MFKLKLKMKFFPAVNELGYMGTCARRYSV